MGIVHSGFNFFTKIANKYMAELFDSQNIAYKIKHHIVIKE